MSGTTQDKMVTLVTNPMPQKTLEYINLSYTLGAHAFQGNTVQKRKA